MSRHHNQHQNGRYRTAQAQMVSVALYSAIVVIGISTVVIVGQPILEDMRDAEAVDAAKTMLTDIETAVRAVADADEGSRTEIGLRFARGTFIFDGDDDTITYELETDADIISPGTSRQIGDLRISSMAGVTVEHTTVDNQPCWRMTNEHVSVCIRDIPQNTSEQIRTDTVGYWRFNRNQGSTAYDNSSYEYNGDITGTRWTDGMQGSALAFSDSGDYITVPGSDGGTLDLTGSLTVSAWVNMDGYDDGSWSPIVTKGDSQYALHHDGSTDEWVFTLSDGTTHEVREDAAGDTGNWVHLLGTYNSSTGTMRFYRNGNLSDTTTGGITSNSVDVAIGRNEQQTGRVFDGRIDEIRIWNRSLSADEVDWIYRQQGRLDFIDTEDLILAYRNRDANEELDADFGVSLRAGEPVDFTNNGTGYVEPDLTGNRLGRGQITAKIASSFGVDYNILFTLRSGSDFLQVDVED